MALTQQQYLSIANSLKVDTAAVKAVVEVESKGSGFDASGKPKILFEGHRFWRQLRKAGVDPTKYVRGNENILYREWTRQHYVGGPAEYERLNKAKKLSLELTKSEDAALCSASYGAFQIMGENYSQAGFGSVTSFVEAMQSELGQVSAFISFIKKDGRLERALQNKDWEKFARIYNGPKYQENQYDQKLKKSHGIHLFKEKRSGQLFIENGKLDVSSSKSEIA
jgi:hypothetical protein